MIDGAASMVPLYEQVKSHILKQVASGELPALSRVPSENELVKMLGVSRMTVNRALNDLTTEGVLVRTPGVGTFVAEHSVRSHPLQIHNIADEVRGRGHDYGAEVILCEATVADQQQAHDFAILPNSRLFRSLVLHLENGVPIQLEDRYVNPSVAPGYMSLDFTEHTPHEYLMKVAPLQKAEHILQAAIPSAEDRNHLKMSAGEPCLVLRRRTWTSEIVASCAVLSYPASRYEFAGRFTL